MENTSVRRWQVRDDELLSGSEGSMSLIVGGIRCIGAPPRVMGIGPAYAIPMVLKNAGLSVADVDLFEVRDPGCAPARISRSLYFSSRSTKRSLPNMSIASRNSVSTPRKSMSTEARSRLDIR